MPSALLEGQTPQCLVEETTFDTAIRFSRRGQGLRLILGTVETPAMPDETVLRLVARAARWQRTWFEHPEKTLADIAAADGISFYDASKQIRLAFLTPHILDAILRGEAEYITAERLRRIAHLPARWSDQKALLGIAGDQALRRDTA